MGRVIRVAFFGLSLALVPACSEDAKGSAFYDPPPEEPLGKTYAEWSELWQRWFLSISCDSEPCENHPANDATGALCGVGQNNQDVWFMAGTKNVFDGDPVLRDQCVVPTGMALLFGPLNASCPVPVYGKTVEAAAASCEATMDGATALEVTVDGESAEDPWAYRAASGPFTITYPDPNIFSKPVGLNEQVVSDGYWVMVRPLSAGAHTIRSRGEHSKFAFVSDATYELTVE